jgi:serine/threonine-protein kinase
MNARKYEPLFELAVGGMGTVYVGAARGALGFTQIVALKRPHPHTIDDPEQRRALRNEARVASLLHHANIVDVRDVEEDGASVWLVMDYVEGASLAELVVEAGTRATPLRPGIVIRIVLDACAGLAAAHGATNRSGEPLAIVHRDVSPQNLLIGLDGVTRLTDFGIAKALDGPAATAPGMLKGKVAYMAPEYLRGATLDGRADVFALGVVLWEALAGARLFRVDDDDATRRNVLEKQAPSLADTLGPELDAVVARALKKSRNERFGSARALHDELEHAARARGLLATTAEVGDLVQRWFGERIEERRSRIAALVDDPAAVSSLRPAPITERLPPRAPERTVVMPAAPRPSAAPPVAQPGAGARLFAMLFVAVALVLGVVAGVWALTGDGR